MAAIPTNLTSSRTKPQYGSRIATSTSWNLSRLVLPYSQWYLFISLFLLAIYTTRANAEITYSHSLPVSDDPITNCSMITDNYVGNPQTIFSIGAWIGRGLCIRGYTDTESTNNDFQCYTRLQNVLENNINEIRKAEFNGAAGVLALLPTIGALLGAPTRQNWLLLTMIPFAGFLAMACSFGGAIFPTQLKDYESKLVQDCMGSQGERFSSFLDMRNETSTDNWGSFQSRADRFISKIRRRIDRRYSEVLPVAYIIGGMVGMLILLAASQVAMLIVELGAVLPWWCESQWWIHLWYLMILVTAVIYAYILVPFKHQWRLRLSDVPYDVEVIGGDPLIGKDTADNLEGVDTLRMKLQKLTTMMPGTISFLHHRQHRARPLNALCVQVSTLSSVNGRRGMLRGIFLQSMSVVMSVGLLIFGTTCFASAQLLPISMSTFVLTCVLGAGVFSRAVTIWAVDGVDAAEPMIHYVASDEMEAMYILGKLFIIGEHDESGFRRKIQIEMDGHIFVDQRRIARRSPWPARFLGILVRPYDLADSVASKMDRKSSIDIELADVQHLDADTNAAHSGSSKDLTTITAQAARDGALNESPLSRTGSSGIESAGIDSTIHR